MIINPGNGLIVSCACFREKKEKKNSFEERAGYITHVYKRKFTVKFFSHGLSIHFRRVIVIPTYERNGCLSSIQGPQLSPEHQSIG